jgi:hypothetical protein
MRLAMLAVVVAVVCLGGTSVAVGAPRLGTPEVITSFDGEAHLRAASSAAGHPDAYAVFNSRIGENVYSVVHRDRDGHAHRFDIPTRRGTYPEAIRLVALEAGGGMAIWDEQPTRRVLARSWRSDGRLGATQVVLSQVTTTHSAENDSAQWRVRADGRGTVVVATTGAAPHDGASVFAAVRDAGGDFAAQQMLTPPGETGVDQRQLSISPIAADGSVAVAWGPEHGEGTGGLAVRRGRSATFAPPAARTFSAELGLSAQHRSVFTADGQPVTISQRLARLCPCVQPQVFDWGAARVLVFARTKGRSGIYLRGWYVAHRNARGVFDTVVEATRNADSSLPVRRARTGEIGFASFDDIRFRRRSRLVVVPFGPRVARSRRAPRLRFGTDARATSLHLLVPVYCDRVCRVDGSAGGRRLAINDFLGNRIGSLLEPFTVAYLRVPPPGHRKTVHVSASAIDDAGHRASVHATFLRSRRTWLWCVPPKSRC